MIGKNTMNRYYIKTDQSEVYRIAMGKSSTFYSLVITFTYCYSILVLHPRHKLEYFKAQKWENEWIQAARDIVREEFDRSYKESASDNAMQVDSTVSTFKSKLPTYTYFFSHPRLRCRRRTSLTISLIWPPQPLTTVMSLNVTLRPMLRM